MIYIEGETVLHNTEDETVLHNKKGETVLHITVHTRKLRQCCITQKVRL